MIGEVRHELKKKIIYKHDINNSYFTKLDEKYVKWKDILKILRFYEKEEDK